MHLDSSDRAMLAGDHGEAAAFSMRIIRRLGEAMGADRLVDITSAHVDSCLYLGPAAIDFVQHLVDGDGAVSVDTTLNCRRSTSCIRTCTEATNRPRRRLVG